MVENKKEKKEKKKKRPLGHGKQKGKSEERFRKCRFHSDLYVKPGWSSMLFQYR
jgi:ribosomal protein L19E